MAPRYHSAIPPVSPTHLCQCFPRFGVSLLSLFCLPWAFTAVSHISSCHTRWYHCFVACTHGGLQLTQASWSPNGPNRIGTVELLNSITSFSKLLRIYYLWDTYLLNWSGNCLMDWQHNCTRHSSKGNQVKKTTRSQSERIVEVGTFLVKQHPAFSGILKTGSDGYMAFHWHEINKWKGQSLTQVYPHSRQTVSLSCQSRWMLHTFAWLSAAESTSVGAGGSKYLSTMKSGCNRLSSACRIHVQIHASLLSVQQQGLDCGG